MIDENEAGDALADARAWRTAENDRAFERAMQALCQGYPPSEIQSWERQRDEALAWEADSEAPTPWIDIAAQARGLDRGEFLARTLAKVHQFSATSAFLVGRRQAIADAIYAAEKVEDLDALALDYALPEG